MSPGNLLLVTPSSIEFYQNSPQTVTEDPGIT